LTLKFPDPVGWIKEVVFGGKNVVLTFTSLDSKLEREGWDGPYPEEVTKPCILWHYLGKIS